jgi:hypothetical protein
MTVADPCHRRLAWPSDTPQGRAAGADARRPPAVRRPPSRASTDGCGTMGWWPAEGRPPPRVHAPDRGMAGIVTLVAFDGVSIGQWSPSRAICTRVQTAPARLLSPAVTSSQPRSPLALPGGQVAQLATVEQRHPLRGGRLEIGVPGRPAPKYASGPAGGQVLVPHRRRPPARCRFIITVLHQGKINPTALPSFMGQISPKI